MTGYFIIAVLLLSGFAHFLPEWIRRDDFFGVTVDPSFRSTDAARGILGRYRMMLWSFTAGSIILFFATGFIGVAVLQVAGFFSALAFARRSARAHATTPSAILDVDLAAPPETLPGGPLVACLPSVSLTALAVWASRHWDRLPAEIPVHWGLHGADRWVAGTPTGVYGLIAIHAAISLSLLLCAWGILHWSRRVSTGQALAAGDREFRRINVQICLIVSFAPAIQAWILLLQPNRMGMWWGVALLLVLTPFFVRLIRLIRYAAGDRTPDTCWKLGMFYFNPEDPSIFVAKRFGIGYTLNFGNRWSWAVLGALMVTIFARALLRK